MKIQTTTLQRISASIAALGLLLAIPVLQADDDKTKVKIKDGDKKVKIKGKAARDLLKPEVTSTWVQGYTVPQEYHTHFTEVPVVKEENVVVRYYGGRAYYVNSNDWKIVRVVDVDPTVEVSTDTSAYVEGYVIPETRRTHFVEVPNPDAGVSVRYYNNTAYYMDDQYRIVRTVPLATR
jgi:hypothetical protein